MKWTSPQSYFQIPVWPDEMWSRKLYITETLLWPWSWFERSAEYSLYILCGGFILYKVILEFFRGEEGVHRNRPDTTYCHVTFEIKCDFNLELNLLSRNQQWPSNSQKVHKKTNKQTVIRGHMQSRNLKLASLIWQSSIHVWGLNCNSYASQHVSSIIFEHWTLLVSCESRM